VVHLHGPDRADDADAHTAPRAGFVVSKAIGNSVVRHRVARRLRHLVRDRLAGLPADSLLVIRALPHAASATSAELGEDLDAGLRSALRKRGPS
jgi:ribonuclease P protein component